MNGNLDTHQKRTLINMKLASRQWRYGIEKKMFKKRKTKDKKMGFWQRSRENPGYFFGYVSVRALFIGLAIERLLYAWDRLAG